MGKLSPARAAWVAVAAAAASVLAFLLGVRVVGGVLMVVTWIALGIFWLVWMRSRR